MSPLLRAPLAALAVALLCGACADGYPSEDVPPVDPARLDRAGLLQALDDLGAQHDLKPRRSYRLQANCVLEATVHRRVGVQQRVAAPLLSTQVELRFDGESRRYDVVMVATEGAASAPAPGPAEAPEMLAGARWVDAVTMRSLLRHLQADCARARAGTAAA